MRRESSEICHFERFSGTFGVLFHDYSKSLQKLFFLSGETNI